jgi:hypothetical protein
MKSDAPSDIEMGRENALFAVSYENVYVMFPIANNTYTVIAVKIVERRSSLFRFIGLKI